MLLPLIIIIIIIMMIIISQSVIRVVYRQDDVIHKFVWKIMAFPFLHAQHIQSTFVRIESLVQPNGEMCELINYVCQPCIEHPVFVTHCWTVYNITVRFSHNRSGPFCTVNTEYMLPLALFHG